MSPKRSVAVAAAVMATMVGAGCSAAKGAPATNASSTNASGSSVSTTAPPATLPAVPPTLAITPTTILPPGHVGDAVYLPTTGSDPAVQVTLLRFVDPAQGADQFSVPIAGGRLVAAQLRITTAAGSVALDTGGATILDDAQGNVYSPIDANITGCPTLGVAPLKPGSTTTGCLTFDVPVGTGVSEITFTPLGQFGTVSAEWLIP